MVSIGLTFRTLLMKFITIVININQYQRNFDMMRDVGHAPTQTIYQMKITLAKLGPPCHRE
jgi:hypothetical protein